VTFTSATTLTGAVDIDTGAGAGTVAFNNTLDGTTTATETLEITAGTGNIDFGGAVGNTADLGAVTINSAATLTADQAFKAGSFTQSAGSVATQFDGAVTLTGNFDFTGTALTFNAAGNTVGGTMDVTNTGLFTTADNADIEVTGQFTQDGSGVNGTNSLGGDLTATAGMNFATAVALIGTDAVTLVTGGAAGQDIVLGTDATTDITGAGQALVLNAGALGDITVEGDVGADGAALGAITIVGADQVLFDETVIAASFTQDAAAASGLTTFDGAVDVSGDFEFTGYGLTFNDTVVVGGDVEISNTGGLLMAADGDVSAGGSFVQDGAGEVRIAASDLAATQNISLTGATVIANDVNLRANQISIETSLNSAVDGFYALTLNAQDLIDLGALVGQSARLGSLATGNTGEIVIDSTLVSTTDNQLYQVPLTFTQGNLTSPLVLASQSGDIEFMGTVSAGGNAKASQRSLSVSAPAGNVYVRDQIGVSLVGVSFGDYVGTTDVNPYGLTVSAPNIWLYADITTFEQQLYDGNVNIGSNDTNGFTRLLASLDPSVVFLGDINDTVPGKHILDVRAVSMNASNGLLPEISFERAVGQLAPLAGLRAFAGIQSRQAGAGVGDVLTEPRSLRYGTVDIGGNVSTVGDQTYIGGSIEIGVNNGQPVVLYTENGQVRMLARPATSGGLNNGENLDILLDDGASLSQDTIDLITQSGLSLADIVSYVGFLGSQIEGDGGSTAGVSLEQVTEGQAVEQSRTQANVVPESKEVLLQAEVGVGEPEAVEAEAVGAEAVGAEAVEAEAAEVDAAQSEETEADDCDAPAGGSGVADVTGGSSASGTMDCS
jgi:hypothetical protein